ncbi:hypothetical protein [Paraclostridium tenue]|uniref:Uncharacterized protein n=1 Tax=Paraclostridium tenue TaxID=1737 RepID=A0ABN1M3D9_9FIRM
MSEFYNKFCCEDNTDSDYDDIKNKISSVCCNPDSFIKEQFTLRTTATTGVKTVYIANPGMAFVRGTVILRNLSRATINFVVDGSNIVVEANDEAVISVAALNAVTVQILSGAQTARVLLFFDIQYPSI